ncbi:hypothetical protein P9869_17520 [Streptomyces ossamyceticus]|nr:hypothetical protein [Streptomyces ossamyceticus]
MTAFPAQADPTQAGPRGGRVGGGHEGPPTSTARSRVKEFVDRTMADGQAGSGCTALVEQFRKPVG